MGKVAFFSNAVVSIHEPVDGYIKIDHQQIAELSHSTCWQLLRDIEPSVNYRDLVVRVNSSAKVFSVTAFNYDAKKSAKVFRLALVMMHEYIKGAGDRAEDWSVEGEVEADVPASFFRQFGIDVTTLCDGTPFYRQSISNLSVEALDESLDRDYFDLRRYQERATVKSSKLERCILDAKNNESITTIRETFLSRFGGQLAYLLVVAFMVGLVALVMHWLAIPTVNQIGVAVVGAFVCQGYKKSFLKWYSGMLSHQRSTNEAEIEPLDLLAAVEGGVGGGVLWRYMDLLSSREEQVAITRVCKAMDKGQVPNNLDTTYYLTGLEKIQKTLTEK